MDQYSDIGIDIREQDDSVLVVVAGEVDLCAAPELEQSLAKAGASGAARIVLDLDRVSFMDSAGVHVVLRFAISERNRDRLVLSPGSPQVQRLLSVTGVRRYLSFVT
jgi:anti-sigma B factor antagonist